MAAKQAMRFAAGPILKSIRNILVPTNEAGKVAYGQLAARYAPDLLYSGLSAAMLPQGATGLERAGVAAEDLGIGLIGSLAGQLGGAGTARLASRMAGKKLGQEGADLAATTGDLLVGAPVNMFAPVRYSKALLIGLRKRNTRTPRPRKQLRRKPPTDDPAAG